MTRISAISTACAHDAQITCGSCRLSNLCLPLSLHLEDIDRLDRIIQRSKPLQRGDYLYRANDDFKALYAVRSGAVKTVTLSEKGEERITGFYLPGEVVGMEGIAHNIYANSASALETSSICEIPFARIEELSLQLPSLQRSLFQLLSREITQEQQLVTLLSKSSAEQRLAALLLSLSRRNQQRQLSANAFRLPMSRTDIGNFLGLTIETISRVINRMQNQGIVSIDKKEVHIIDPAGLKQLAEVND